MDTEGNWTTRPTKFEVWLHRGSVKYTIEPYFEDLWERYDGFNVVNVHAAPEDGGHGAPYYGLVTSIEDRYGNLVRMHYCDFYQYTCDNEMTDLCIECCQNCREKGQLKAVTLHPAGEAAASWTILYVHREFDILPWDFIGPLPPEWIFRSNENRLHSIHVYEGDPGIDLENLTCLTLSQDAFYVSQTPGEYPVPFDSLDEYDEVDAKALLSLPSNSVIDVRYMYEEGIGLLYHQFDGYLWTPLDGDGENWLLSDGILKKATVARLDAETKKHTCYLYHRHPPTASSPYDDPIYGPTPLTLVAGLKAVFYDETVG